MTKVFDDRARQYMIENFDELVKPYDGTPVREMKVLKVDAKTARPYIASFHYSKTMPDSTKHIYMGFLGDSVCGIVCYGMGTSKNQYLSIYPKIKQGEYLELTRLWCANDMPKNTESKLIGESLKMLPDEVKLVMSFADDSKSHKGTIYQATNWLYLGVNNGGKMLVCDDGIEKHPRLLGMYRKRHPEYKALTNEELMNLYNWKYKEGGKKHRYVFIRGDKKGKKTITNYIKDRILPYPKFEGSKNHINEKEILRNWNFGVDTENKEKQLTLFETGC